MRNADLTSSFEVAGKPIRGQDRAKAKAAAGTEAGTEVRKVLKSRTSHQKKLCDSVHQGWARNSGDADRV